MTLQIRLAVRDWDYIVPLALGDVVAEGLDLRIDRVPALPEDLAADPRYDAGEMSMSRYCLGRLRGRDDIAAVPHFLMRGFRHRCIITHRDSGITQLEQLAGARIGMTGWQDSGNTWTRALLRRVGIGIDDAQWRVGRLTAAHPVADRLSGYGQPGRIEAVAGERPLVDLLRSGELEAVFTPFMPDGFFDADSDLRQLLPQCRRDEVAYFRDVGYVPGMHLLGIKPDILRAHPWVGQSLSAALDASAAMWLHKRRKYADTTPWILDELIQTSRDLPEGWDRNGLQANQPMVTDFLAELRAQRLTERSMSPAELFAHG
ncbi:nitrate ABC transporter substrate-binding protein [Achromobacter sp. AONIH1]|jgi:4,5-dihydroxyphthalate decarboxylase|uniref:nitrate ABC transporter substrate-binding protein n=1 Tax=unclassified Achromobacter TaxID=2626865 RepID=UPI000CCFF378|nr:nitrate ABC transporter substrate-binding protein [Achromobacter sp. AONIH1]AUT49142.1 nitrate ABC transporter substrate-binding protein [Achromobacter sp. AONIH1]